MSSMVDVPYSVGKLLTDVVSEFAHVQGLVCHPWYHDAPLWLIEHEKDGLRHTVQIAAWLAPDDQFLFFTPHVWIHEGGENKGTLSAKRDIKIALDKLQRLVEKKKKAARTQILKMLEEAWAAAEELTRDHIT